MTDAEVLQRRARELAQPLAGRDDTSAPRRLLRFRRVDDHCAVDLAAVQKVARLDGSARLPRDAWPLLAIAPLDGRIVPVVDPFTQGEARATPEPLAWGVAVEARGHVLFVLADEVIGVVDIDPGEVTDTPSDDSDWCVVGVSQAGDAIVDVDALVASLEYLRADTTPAGDGAQAVRDRP